MPIYLILFSDSALSWRLAIDSSYSVPLNTYNNAFNYIDVIQNKEVIKKFIMNKNFIYELCHFDS